ncbi:MAG: hypothetical protein D6734_09675 [Candidatus Schekmanbacteria bacterium]|nr:MAG: hypothetical protein D6734_09675 [Candidatus Schekmanbacteria bacterium]
MLLAVVTGALVSLIFQLKRSLQKVEKTIGDIDEKVLPLIEEAQVSINNINSITDKVDRGLSSAEKAMNNLKLAASAVKQVGSTLSSDGMLRFFLKSGALVGIKAAAGVLKERLFQKGGKKDGK